MKDKVTFETKCYEMDWRHLLQTDRLRKAISYHQYPFAETILSINNVHDVEEVSFYASKLVEQGVLTSYIIVEQFADEALAYFNIEKDSFRGGYYYSIAELVSIYRCRTTYNETHPDSARYPVYGGELFEKRVDAWMRNHQYYRLTYKFGSYLHPSY